MIPTISINVDVFNPGQVFACFGLFELADRLSCPDKIAKSWFEQKENGSYFFNIEAYGNNEVSISLDTVLSKLKECKIRENEGKDGPIFLEDPFNFLIDWRKAFPQKSTVKTWSGKQDLREMVSRMKHNIPDKTEGNIFSFRVSTKSLSAFDASKAETAQDAGFSFNNLDSILENSFSIITELLALIGLQFFCPLRIDRFKRSYKLWFQPTSKIVASVALNDDLSFMQKSEFQFDMYSRDTDNRYKSFSYSKLVK